MAGDDAPPADQMAIGGDPPGPGELIAAEGQLIGAQKIRSKANRRRALNGADGGEDGHGDLLLLKRLVLKPRRPGRNEISGAA